MSLLRELRFIFYLVTQWPFPEWNLPLLLHPPTHTLQLFTPDFMNFSFFKGNIYREPTGSGV